MIGFLCVLEKSFSFTWPHTHPQSAPKSGIYIYIDHPSANRPSVSFTPYHVLLAIIIIRLNLYKMYTVYKQYIYIHTRPSGHPCPLDLFASLALLRLRSWNIWDVMRRSWSHRGYTGPYSSRSNRSYPWGVHLVHLGESSKGFQGVLPQAS